VDYYDELVQALILGEVASRDDLLRLKAKLCKKHNMSKVPPNFEILARVPDEYRDVLEPFLRNKPVRTMSGVAPVAVMTSPFDCPHGRCTYCPGGTSNNTPQSYTGREPAALRAAMYDYDPFKQTEGRLKQFHAIGHRTDKVDLIIMGGTFTSRPENYQDWFVKRCFDAMNGVDSSDLVSSQRANELAGARCVGLTLETRPDWYDHQIEHSLSLGATKVEFGVQILNDKVLDGVKRGHHIKDVAEATRRAKDAGLKVAYHIMPGLPGSDVKKDTASFRTMIEDERFKPDMLKIYPTLVVKGTGLYEDWVLGKYSPMPLEGMVRLLADFKRITPPWIRILRIQRDIPVQLIEAGIKKSHLRELVMNELHSAGTPCRCIRCREIGHLPSDKKAPLESEAELTATTYHASGGSEIFLAYEIASTDSIVGYARLRFPSNPGAKAALLRELHIYGQMAPIYGKPSAHWQHKGFGEKLLKESEIRAHAGGYRELCVTSGVGARDYYRRLGYELKGPYMAKKLRG
jgi:elongator complex protein 3